MVDGSRQQRYRSILNLGLPISAGMLSQSILSLVDIGMVAQLNDPAALAAVGIGSFAAYLAVAMTLGLSVGVQAMVARRLGEEDHQSLLEPLNAGLWLALLSGGLLTVLLYFTAADLVALLNEDPRVREIGSEYLIWRVFGIAAVAVNFSYRGFWNGVKQSMTYMKILLVMHLCNFAFSYCLIFGAFGFPEMGAPGSGLGTTISLLIGFVLYTVLTVKRYPGNSLFYPLPSRAVVDTILKLAIPNSAQQTLGALGICIFYVLLGKVSVEALAAGHAIINISLFIFLPGTGMGLAVTTLVANSLGKNQPDNAYRWGWDGVKLTAPILAVMALPLVIAPQWILSLFLPADPELIRMAAIPLQITGATAFLQGFSLCLSQALYGAGANKQVFTASALIQWCIGLPLAYLVGIHLGYGIVGMWMIQVVERVLGCVVYSRMWMAKRWQSNQF